MFFKVSGTAKYNWRTVVEAETAEAAEHKAIQALIDGAVTAEDLVDNAGEANITVDTTEGGW